MLLASSLAILIADDLDPDIIGLLATLFTAIGDNLAVIATKRQICEDSKYLIK